MAKTITPIDASAIIEAVAKQALGEAACAKIDFTDHVSVGEKIMAAGYENVLGALSLVYGETVVGIKPYKARFNLIQEEGNTEFANQMRKIIYFRKPAQEAGDRNTDKHVNLKTGYNAGVNGSSTTGSVGDQWEQNLPVTCEIWFGGREVWDLSITILDGQLDQAFRSPEDFAKFWNGVLTEKQNEIEIAKENYNRGALLNYIGGLYTLGTTPFTNAGTDYKMPGSAVNLTAAYNAKYGLTGQNAKTTTALLTTDYDSFLKFFVAEIKKYSNYMAELSQDYQIPLAKKEGSTLYYNETQCPKDDQRLMLLKDLIIDAEANVLPEIFNDQYLKIENYEPVDFWQSRATRDKVMVKCNIPTVTKSSNEILVSNTQTVADNVTIDHVVGVLFDKAACRTQFQFESADATSKEARKRYTNVWYHNSKNRINDFSCKGIVFYMADPAVES